MTNKELEIEFTKYFYPDWTDERVREWADYVESKGELDDIGPIYRTCARLWLEAHKFKRKCRDFIITH